MRFRLLKPLTPMGYLWHARWLKPCTSEIVVSNVVHNIRTLQEGSMHCLCPTIMLGLGAMRLEWAVTWMYDRITVDPSEK